MGDLRQPDQGTVARRAGVSVGTVSNAINRPALLSKETRERVQAAIDELGYVPNRSAATLRSGSSRLLGLVIPEVTNPFYAAIVDAVVNVADEYGYGVSLCVSHEDVDRERRHFELLAQQRAAGALVVPISEDMSRLEQLRSVGTRLVLVDRLVDESQGCSVAVDDVLGGDLAVSHLLQCDGEGITLVNGLRSIPQCRDRWEGSRRALAAAGIDPSSLVEFQVAVMTVEEGVKIGRQILETGAPRRIFCINDQLATGVIAGLAEGGVSVPGNASVVGYGDLGIASGRGLSTVGQPKNAMGATAVRKLLGELHDGANHTHSATVFPPQLVLRESTTRM